MQPLQAQGLRFAPNQSATKFTHLLGLVDPDRTRDLCLGTVDSWIIWNLTEGAAHVTDVSNAAVTGLMHADASGWDASILAALDIPSTAMPRLVDSSGPIAAATARPAIATAASAARPGPAA